jgi:hypothetical protein
MMRRVREQVIWLRGSYHFESREAMYAALVSARKLLESNPRPLSLYTTVLGNELAVIVKVPMFEHTATSAEMFNLLANAARTSALEARVDVA